MESDIFMNGLINCVAYMVWPYLNVSPKMEVYSNHDPAWIIAYSLPIWIRGFIDYDKCGYIFLDPKFTENLIIAIRNELEINTLNYNACTLYYQYYPATPNITVHIAHLEAVCRIYYTILQKLDIVKMTNNVGNLVDIPGLLFSDRNHLANL